MRKITHAKLQKAFKMSNKIKHPLNVNRPIWLFGEIMGVS